MRNGKGNHMSDQAYYEMMGTTEEIEKLAEKYARACGWEPNDRMEGFVNESESYWQDGFYMAMANIHAKTWKQLCEDEGICY